MRKPTLCMIFEAIGPYNAIGKVAECGVRAALAAGWQVTVVAKLLDESLQSEVEWLKLTVPPRLFLLKWVTARYFIQQALGGRAFDVVHAHQPQAAGLADVFQCHFLTRMAYQRGSLESCATLHGVIIRAQQQGVLYAEDYYYRHWNPQTRMFYVSDLTRSDFHTLYGPLPQEDVLLCAFPPIHFPTAEERQQARAALIGRDIAGPVVGFLGGLHERKGYRRLIKGLEDSPNAFLLMGGQYCEGFEAPTLRGRFKSAGMVEDVAAFYAACDVFAVPSHYEPLGLVAFEAAARGLPVIATPEVGALPHLLNYNAGMEWDPEQLLEPLLCHAAANRSVFQEGARRMAADMGQESYSQCLLTVYQEVLERKRNLEHSAQKP